MRLLITADWQTRPSNLGECRFAAKRIFELVREEDLSTVVVAGDVKDQYNPLDLRVLDFWRWFIGALENRHCRTILVMGNHDRAALSHDQFNWMPALQDAGAVTFEQEGVFRLGDSKIFGLPFSASASQFATRVDKLGSMQPDPERDILVFHETLLGASWNRQTDVTEDDTPVTAAAMHPERYRYAVGGDIHMHQQLAENAWYVGSPFPHTWGECNQEKVYAIIRDDSPIRFVPTGAPGWYDPDVRGFSAPKSWENARVRLRVPIAEGDDYGAKVLRAKADAEKRYQGAHVTVQASVEDGGGDRESARTGQTEAQNIRDYVENAIDAEDVDAATAYIQSRLESASTRVRRSGGVKFRKVVAGNFLCYKELELNLDKPGITVITGEYLGQPDKSNGSGKTSLLSALPVALYGRTFKGQDHDSWARRGSRKAFAYAEFELPGGQIVRAERTRKPASVRLFVDDAEISAGGRQADVSKDIEAMCGFSWDTFASTVFLSQEEIGAFLRGTPKDRHEVIAGLQNLERFETAWDAAGKDVKREDSARRDMADDIREAKDRLQAFQDISNVAEEQGRAKAEKVKAEKRFRKAADAVPPKPQPGARDTARTDAAALAESMDTVRDRESVIIGKIRELEALPEECPTCGKPMDRDDKAIKKSLAKLDEQLDTVQKEHKKLQGKYDEAHAEYERLAREYLAAIDKRKDAKSDLGSAEKQLRLTKEELARWDAKAAEERGEIERWKETLGVRERSLDAMCESAKFYRACHKILHRDGLPAYLSEMLCPRLNAAADHIAQLFTDGEIRVRFSVENGKVRMDIINPHGGETVRDQSNGESRVAALIASFALREAAGRSNILILDEPTGGMDVVSCRAFARGLAKLARSVSIYVITHDTSLASEISAARHIHVVKRDGIAEITA